MDLAVWLILLAIGPALVGALLPGRWAYAWFGWYALILGLLILDFRSYSIMERNDMFGMAEASLWAWSVVGALAFLLRLLVDAIRARRPPETNPARRFLVSWELPVAILLAAGFFHW